MNRCLTLGPLLCATSLVHAHSASDAYLTLTVAQDAKTHRAILHGEWDIALRDLDFVLTLDDNGDGQVTWGEVKHHAAAIEKYAYDHLAFSDERGSPCKLKPVRQWVAGHADGAYAALYFDAACAGSAPSLQMNYTLFFAVDPSHRGIFVMHSGENVSTAVLSPVNAKITLTLDKPSG